MPAVSVPIAVSVAVPRSRQTSSSRRPLNLADRSRRAMRHAPRQPKAVCSLTRVAQDAAVGQGDDPVASRGKLGIVCNHHQRRLRLCAAREQHVDDRVAGRNIEISGRLVGEKQLRSRGDCASDGDALLLAARKLLRIMVEPVTQADRLEFCLRAIAGVIGTGQFERAWRRFPVAVIVGNRWKACSTMPMRPRLARASESSSSEAKSSPPTVSLPPLARSRPVSTAINELLPEPEGPSSASVSPAMTFRSIPLRMETGAVPLPRVRVSASAKMTGEGLVTSVRWHRQAFATRSLAGANSVVCRSLPLSCQFCARSRHAAARRTARPAHFPHARALAT